MTRCLDSIRTLSMLCSSALASERLSVDTCCFSHFPVEPPRELTALFRRRISWDDGAIREPAGAGGVTEGEVKAHQHPPAGVELLRDEGGDTAKRLVADAGILGRPRRTAVGVDDGSPDRVCARLSPTPARSR